MVAAFEDKQFVCFNYILLINKLINPGVYSSVATYTPAVKSMVDVRSKLIEQKMDHEMINPEVRITSLNLLTVNIKNPIFSAFFRADKGFIKFAAEVIYEDE
jgi:hypothetical protein